MIGAFSGQRVGNDGSWLLSVSAVIAHLVTASGYTIHSAPHAPPSRIHTVGWRVQSRQISGGRSMTNGMPSRCNLLEAHHPLLQSAPGRSPKAAASPESVQCAAPIAAPLLLLRLKRLLSLSLSLTLTLTGSLRSGGSCGVQSRSPTATEGIV